MNVLIFVLSQVALYLGGVFIKWDLHWFYELSDMHEVDRAMVAFSWFAFTIILNLMGNLYRG